MKSGENEGSWVEENLVIVPMKSDSATEAIKRLGGCLEASGFVKPSWTPAALGREREFATGLPTGEIGVAIPHTDAEHVLKNGIAVGVVEQPVDFGEMGNPDSTVPVRIVCALAVAQSDRLVTVLQQLVKMFQTPDLLVQIAAAEEPSEIVRVFNHHLKHGPGGNASES
jgi:PTS system galactitol-specific IIA component